MIAHVVGSDGGACKLMSDGYHPQTDGLVKKFNSMLINMISKSSDSGGPEQDQQLPLSLFAYRSTIQESTRESPFFLLYGCDPQLPTGSMLDEVEPAYLMDMEDYCMEFLASLAKVKKIALENIQQAQAKQKEFYDRQAGNPQYRLGE